MQLDCHYYGTYYMARQAGFSRDDAKVIAWAAETVDELDFEHVIALKEKGVKIPYFVTAEGMFDRIYDQYNSLTRDEGIEQREIRKLLRGIWVPFHFLPGNFIGAVDRKDVWHYEGWSFIEMACQEASDLYDNTKNDGIFRDKSVLSVVGSTYLEDMALLCRTSTNTVRAIIENAKDQYLHYYGDSGCRIRALCAVGICMHVLADTWSHQGFAGTPSRWVNDCDILENNVVLSSSGDSTVTKDTEFTGIKQELNHVANPIFVRHGAASVIPDIPGATWNVRHAYRKSSEKINNSKRFISGLLQMYDAMKYIIDFAETVQDLTPEAELPQLVFRSKMDLEASAQSAFESMKGEEDHDDLRIYNILTEIASRTLDNRSSDTTQRIDQWKAYLEEHNESIEDYEFDETKVIPFAQMARIHRKVVCDFLREKHCRIIINPDTVDRAAKREFIRISPYEQEIGRAHV